MPFKLASSADTNSGMTLVEVLMALVILGFVSAGVAQLFSFVGTDTDPEKARIVFKDQSTIVGRRLLKRFKARANSAAYGGDVATSGSGIDITHYLSTDIHRTSVSSFRTACVSLPPNHGLNAAAQDDIRTSARFVCTSGTCQSCVQCGRGQMPIIQMIDIDGGAHPQTFPTSATGGMKQRPIAGGICIEKQALPAGPGAKNLIINISMAVLTHGGTIKVMSLPLFLSVVKANSGVEVLH